MKQIKMQQLAKTGFNKGRLWTWVTDFNETVFGVTKSKNI